MAEIETILLSKLLQWYRLQRHDFMNHWQVIQGYLQLQQPEKALAYMKKMLTVQVQEQKIAQIPEPALAAILLTLIIELRQREIPATLDFPEEMKKIDYWQDHWQKEYAAGLYGYTKECLEATLKAKQLSGITAEVYLFDEPGGLACQIILGNDNVVLFDKMVSF